VLEEEVLAEWVGLILGISMSKIFLVLFLETWDDLDDNNKLDKMKEEKISNMISRLLLQRVLLV
jgi:hypothetical protein